MGQTLKDIFMKEIEVNTKIGVTDPPVSVTFVRTANMPLQRR